MAVHVQDLSLQGRGILAVARLAADGNVLRIALWLDQRRSPLGSRRWISVRGAGGFGASTFRTGAQGEQGDRRKGQLERRSGTGTGQQHARAWATRRCISAPEGPCGR